MDAASVAFALGLVLVNIALWIGIHCANAWARCAIVPRSYDSAMISIGITGFMAVTYALATWALESRF